MVIQENYNLKEHNTFGIRANAKRFIQYDTEAELRQLLQDVNTLLRPILHIGMGSNLLFTKDFNGTILHSNIRFIKQISEDDIYCYYQVGAGVVCDDFCHFAAEHGLGGIENLSNIPGEIGAAAVQNIGAYGVEIKDCIVQVETLSVATAESRVFLLEECQYGYRESIFKGALQGQYIVTAVVIRLHKKPVLNLDYGQIRQTLAHIAFPTVQQVRDAVISIRQEKLPNPALLGNAGSFFKNPTITEKQYKKLQVHYPTMPAYQSNNAEVKIPAAWLIEQCGFKGRTIGDAAVYEKQPLVLVNLKNATAEDIMQLASEIQVAVQSKFEIEITPEVNYI